MNDRNGELRVKAESRPHGGLLARAQRRGVLRVAASYAVIAWLLLQIADVTFDPIGMPKWAMTALIVAAALGFPVAVVLAWFYEIGDHGIRRDIAADGDARPSVHGKRRFADLAIIAVLLVVVAVLLVRQSDIGKPPLPANPAIAVLAFENLSGDPAQEYFSDGLAVEVLDRLGRVPGLRVIASSSSFSFKGKAQDARSVASQLGVTTVLEGSVRRDGPRLKLNAKLVDGTTGFQLWSGSFDREVTDVFAVQAELAAAVIDAIIPAARGDTAPAAPPTTDLDAHDYYLLGTAAQRSRSDARLAESVAHLEKAVALDPSYAQAHAALARSQLLLGRADQPLVPPRAEQAAYKALALDPTLSDAHGALGNVLRYAQRPGAEEAYRRALELNPNNAIVMHDLGVLLSMKPGREAEIHALQDQALLLDPRGAIVWLNKLGRIRKSEGPAAFQQQFEQAMRIFKGDTDGLGTLALAAFTMKGYPYEIYRLGHAIAQAGGEPEMALVAALEALIAVGQSEAGLARIDALRATQGDASSFAPLEIIAAGLAGNSARLDAALASKGRSRRAEYRNVMDAHWYVVLDRLEDAAAALAKAGDYETVPDGGVSWSSLGVGALPAVAHLKRAQGRDAEAQGIVERYRARLRKELGDRAPDAMQNVLLAEVAIAGGERAQAVAHLQAAMQQVPVPDRLHPQLPWWRSLEGEPGYAEVLAELERRRAAIRAQIAALDAQAVR